MNVSSVWRGQQVVYFISLLLPFYIENDAVIKYSDNCFLNLLNYLARSNIFCTKEGILNKCVHFIDETA